METTPITNNNTNLPLETSTNQESTCWSWILSWFSFGSSSNFSSSTPSATLITETNDTIQNTQKVLEKTLPSTKKNDPAKSTANPLTASSITNPLANSSSFGLTPKLFPNTAFNWNALCSQLPRKTQNSTPMEILENLFTGLANMFFTKSSQQEPLPVSFTCTNSSRKQDLGMQGRDVVTFQVTLSAEAGSKSGHIACIQNKQTILEYTFQFNEENDKYTIFSMVSKKMSSDLYHRVTVSLFGTELANHIPIKEYL